MQKGCLTEAFFIWPSAALLNVAMARATTCWYPQIWICPCWPDGLRFKITSQVRPMWGRGPKMAMAREAMSAFFCL